MLKGRLLLLYQLSKTNLRMSAITLIGLAIGLSIVSASAIFLDSNRAEYYLDVFEDRSLEQPEAFRLWSDIRLINQSILANTQESLQELIAEAYLDEGLVPHPFSPYSTSHSDFYFLNTSTERSILGLALDATILDICTAGSSLPTTPNEVLIYSPEVNTSLTINDHFNISMAYTPERDERKYYNFSLTISGIITPSTLLKNPSLNDIIDHHQYYYLIMDLANYLTLFHSLDSIIFPLTNYTYPLRGSSYFLFTHNISALNRYNIVNYVNNLKKFSSSYSWSELLVDKSLDLSFYLNYNNLIREMGNLYNLFFFLFILFVIPTFLLTILLVNFSLGLINEQRKQSLLLYKMRGMSTYFILCLLFLEIIIITILASLIGLFIGIPLAQAITTTTGYLTFDLNNLFPEIIITEGAISLTFIIGFVLTLLSYIPTMVHLSRVKLSEIGIEISKTKTRRPIFFGGNLDLFLLVQGTLGIIITVILMDSFSNTTISVSFMTLLFTLTYLSPLSLLIGFLLSYNRFIPVILHYTGKFFWKKDLGMLATATRNLLVNPKITRRTTILIATTLSFLMILSSFPYSLAKYNMNLVYWEVGSDIRINPGKVDLELKPELRDQLEAIPGLETTRVSILYYYTEDTSSEWEEIAFIGIDEKFPDSVFWLDYFDDDSLEELSTKLYNSSESYPVIIETKTAKWENLSLNDGVLIPINSTFSINVSIEAITDYWPPGIGYHIDGDIVLITTSSILHEISQLIAPKFLNHYSDWFHCKISSNYDSKLIINQAWNISSAFGVERYQFDAAREWINPDTLESKLLWIVTNFNFLGGLSVIFSLIILYTFTPFLTHVKEIGLSRALGMKYKQVFLLIFLEPILLFLYSGIPGAIIGTLLLYGLPNYFNPLLRGGNVLIFFLEFNVGTIIFIFSSILVITLLMGIITSLLATKANISKILKVE